jgi:hypothetical protein
MRFLKGVVASALLVAAAGQAQAGFVQGAQSGTGRIVLVDSDTGAVVSGFAVAGLAANHDLIGLTRAENGGALLYINSNVSNTQMLRINPTTGAVLQTIAVANWTTDGLSARGGAADSVYRSHGANLGGDMHLMAGYTGAESFFFTPGAPLGGVGGDGFGRQFAAYNDGTIKEFHEVSGAILNSFAAPAGGVRGLAYDGSFVYASTANGLLVKMNANTGAVLSSVVVQDGALFGLAAATGEQTVVPVPAGAVLFGLGMVSLGGAGLVRRRRPVAA